MGREPGNTLKTARPFQVSEINQTLKESLGSLDSIDIWKISPKLRSSLNLTLNGIAKKAKVDVALLNSAGRVIQSSGRPNSVAKTLSDIPLETGTFYVRVKLQQGSINTRYALTLAATPIVDMPIPPVDVPAPPTDNPPINPPIPSTPPTLPTPPIDMPSPPADLYGNSFDTATQLTSAAATLQDFVGNRDPNDFLKFGTLTAGQFSMELTGLSDDANLSFYDDKRNLIFSSNNSGTANENINQHLTNIAGSTYYIQVSQAPGKDTNYSLNYSFVPDTPVTTTSGLKYIDLAVGTGATPQMGQTVTVQYTGILDNGKKFDSSRDRNEPFSFTIGIGKVIQGWDEGLSTMKVGGRRQLIIPSNLAYGSRGSGSSIPPNATLVFDVELLGIS
jgi:FKBP-type peptidyl-prolyl cis-trans isomerase